MGKILKFGAMLTTAMTLVACSQNPEETATVEELPVEQSADQEAPDDENTGATGSSEQIGDTGPPDR